MKKILLSIGLVALAMAANAQVAGISKKAVFDNFVDADTSSKVSIDEYSVLTDSTKWDDAIGPNGSPVLTEKASKGIFWGNHTAKVTPPNENFTLTKERKGKGTLKYVVSQDTNVYGPIYLGFGVYASKTLAKKDFLLDLSSNAVVSFSFTNSGAETVRLSLQLKDVKDSTLMYNKTILADPYLTDPTIGDNKWKYQIGRVQGETKPVAPGTTVAFTYDFKDALVGRNKNQVLLATAPFDYSKVKAILITVVNNVQVNPDKQDYRTKPLANYGVEFSNFKLGDTMTILGINNDSASSSSSEEIVSAYDMLGNFVGTGKIKELGLESGRVYIVKSSSETRKIVMTK